MFVEDLITDLATRLATPGWDTVADAIRADSWEDAKKFIESIYGTVAMGKPLSTKQGSMFLTIVTRLHRKHAFSGIYPDTVIDSVLGHPRYKQTPYPSTNVPKEVRYLGDNRLGFRCKKIDEIIQDIKALSNRGMDTSWKEHHRAEFDYTAMLWVVPVTSDNYDGVIAVIGSHGFRTDDAVLEYLALADSSKGQLSTFVYDPESEKVVANICDNEILNSWIKYVIFGEEL